MVVKKTYGGLDEYPAYLDNEAIKGFLNSFNNKIKKAIFLEGTLTIKPTPFVYESKRPKLEKISKFISE